MQGYLTPIQILIAIFPESVAAQLPLGSTKIIHEPNRGQCEKENREGEHTKGQIYSGLFETL